MAPATTPTVTALLDESPCPRVEIVISPMTAGAASITVWRQVDGVRSVVRGAVNTTVSGDAVFVDYEVPLQTPVTYVCQTAGADGTKDGVSLPSATVTVNEARAWLQDPISPASSLPVALVRPRKSGVAVSRRASYAPISHVQDVTVAPVAGSRLPIASSWVRREPEDIPIEVRTTEPATSALRELIRSAFPILLRTPGRVQQLPPLAYLALPTVTERLIYGPDVTIWGLTGQCVAPSTSPVLIPVRTLDDLAAEAATMDGLGDLYASMLNLDRGVRA